MVDAVTAATTTGEPVVAPVVAPAAPPAPIVLPMDPVVPVTADPSVAPAADTLIEYEPTGDAGLDVALSFVGKLGIGMDNPAMKATATGDFSLIKAHLATMGDKARGWEQMVALAEQSFTRTTAANTAKATAVTTAVHDVAGGADNWAAVAAWSAVEASPAEKAEINAMFDSGPVGARAAAKMLVDLYAKAKGTTINPASAVSHTAGASTPTPANGKLDSKQYQTAVRDLHKKLGSRMDASPEYAALRSRLAR